MNIKTFSTQHKLKIKLDECWDRIIPGKMGQIYEFSDTELGLLYLGTNAAACSRRRTACESAGMSINQSGDAEFAASFDPQNPVQVALAIKIAAIKRKRTLSPAHRAKLAVYSVSNLPL